VSMSKLAVAGTIGRYEPLFKAVLSAIGNFVKAAIDVFCATASHVHALASDDYVNFPLISHATRS